MASSTYMPFRSAYANSIMYDHVFAKFKSQKPASFLGQDGDTDFQGLPPHSIPHGGGFKDVKPGTPPHEFGKICIVGAGASGLYLGMMLRDRGFKFDILEASNRVGGRCYTYHFPDDPEHPSPHNYYDAGAMRIPDIPVMTNMFQLLEDLGIKPSTYKLHNDAQDEPCMYNYKHMKTSEIKNKKFDDMIQSHINTFLYGRPDPPTNPPPPLQDKEKWEQTFKTYLEGGDDESSTRQWLMSEKRKVENPKTGKMTYWETELAETFNTSTGLFDQAFTETLCDYYDFSAAKPDDWHRVDGGMSKVTDAMAERIAQPNLDKQFEGVKVSTRTSVVAMKENLDSISVTSIKDGKRVTEDYRAVFNTTTLGCLERMDLSGLNLDDQIRTGIRALSYDRSTKVAIKFSENWWSGLVKDGGVSSSDLPVSNVVYPSWNDGPKTSTVLIVSYTWAQDATRMASLVPHYCNEKHEHDSQCRLPKIDDEVVTLCLENIAKLWEEVKCEPKVTFERLRSLYVTHHAWAWSHDEHSAGAFALFGPGQFKNLYPFFRTPQCGNKFLMCGEAVSAHHAWISGALDSAYNAFMLWLQGHPELESQMPRLKDSAFGGGAGENPEELDETVLYWNARLAPKGIAAATA